MNINGLIFFFFFFKHQKNFLINTLFIIVTLKKMNQINKH